MMAKNLKTQRTDEKIRFELLHPVALMEIAKGFMHGAKKYTDWNWLSNPVSWSVYYGAIQRHLQSFWSGENYDVGKNGSNLLHLAHAGCCIIILLTYQILGVGHDDRFKNDKIRKKI